ncbi:hypothetical protein GUITHDRAFT_118153 [Guillardia theta CCMP2712]|uniref:Uncharacterized protein n=1 Tax=Guillardia theta (strain CCMP2712) TaxID=905079 RepID=L1IHE3_GUITC|nr:hypothetical protein GUITHDRAFT_118153 [Guillardia theta CCMP2712]EKX35663.1 hypothetical protein GUITHDRAFT_118153 [Guillardia theta CCMP2712]|eukprot:XP_005822643.1 hypothetical protein GUITHDRAFT_118153 [Guillardia theta CCMP2712]
MLKSRLMLLDEPARSADTTKSPFVCLLLDDKLLQLSSGGDAVCPLCRGKLSKGDVFSVEQTREARQNLARNASGEDEDGERQTDRVQAEEEEQRLSPKIQALLVDEQEAQQADKTVKSVVSSTFLSCLDETESAMIAAAIPVFRIDGTTSILQPRRLIQDFDSHPQGALLLLSSKVRILSISFPLLPSPRSDLQLAGRRGALAHHGVESSHDGTMVERGSRRAAQQAMHRLHRIGQTRPVTIIGYKCQGTVEQKIMEMQEKKDWLGKAAMMRMEADELLEMRLRLFRTPFLRSSQGCRGRRLLETKVIKLFRFDISPKNLADALKAHNKEAKAQVQLVVLNSCFSHEHAKKLAEVVDFAIGHEDELANDSTIEFSGIFYQSLFQGYTLLNSFELVSTLLES